MRYRLFMTALLAALAIAAALPAPAEARMHAGPNMLSAGHRLRAYLPPPLDGIATPAAAAYGFRKLRSAYAGSVLKLRRTSGGTQDIGFVGNDFDTTSASTFCAATTCFVDTWYDQSGLGRHLLQATTASQPQYIAACKGGLPCAQTTVTSQNMSVASVTPSATITMNVVAQHAVRPGGCMYLAVNFSNNFYQHATLDLVVLQATGGINAVAAGLVWHSHTGVINGASSVVNADGVETTGTVGVVAGAGPLYFSPQAAGATCNNAEMIWWDGYALPAGERASLAANQKSYWGTP